MDIAKSRTVVEFWEDGTCKFNPRFCLFVFNIFSLLQSSYRLVEFSYAIYQCIYLMKIFDSRSFQFSYDRHISAT